MQIWIDDTLGMYVNNSQLTGWLARSVKVEVNRYISTSSHTKRMRVTQSCSCLLAAAAHIFEGRADTDCHGLGPPNRLVVCGVLTVLEPKALG